MGSSCDDRQRRWLSTSDDDVLFMDNHAMLLSDVNAGKTARLDSQIQS